MTPLSFGNAVMKKNLLKYSSTVADSKSAGLLCSGAGMIGKYTLAVAKLR